MRLAQPVLLLAFLISPAAAQTAPTVAAAAQRLQAQFNGLSQPPASFTSSFQKNLQSALAKADCAVADNGMQVDCSKATADGLAALQDSLADLSQSVAEEKTREADAQKLAAQLPQIQQAIGSVQLVSAQANIKTTFAQLLKSAGCQQSGSAYACTGADDKLQDAISEVAQLRSEISQANAAYQQDQPLAQQLAQQLAGAAQRIAGLTPVPQGLVASLASLAKAANCASNGTSYDCSQATASQLQTASTNLQSLERTIGQAQTQDQNNAQAGAVLAQQLGNAAQRIAGLAPVPQAVSANLAAIAKAAGCSSTGTTYNCSQTTASQLQTANAALQSLENTISQVQTQDQNNVQAGVGLAQKLTQIAVIIAGLPSGLQGAMGANLTSIARAAGCASTMAGFDCSKATAGQIATANAALPGLNKNIAQMQAQDAQNAQTLQALDSQIAAVRRDISTLPKTLQTVATNLLASDLTSLGCDPKATQNVCAKAPFYQLAAVPAKLREVMAGDAQLRAQEAKRLSDAQALAQQAQGMLNAILAVSPKSTQQSVSSLLSAALAKAKCVVTGVLVDCSQASIPAVSQLTSDIGNVAFQLKNAQQADARLIQGMDKQMAIEFAALSESADSVAAAAIAGAAKTQMLGQIQQLRDQLMHGYYPPGDTGAVNAAIGLVIGMSHQINSELQAALQAAAKK